LGMEGGCARRPHCCTGVWMACAQRCAQRPGCDRCDRGARSFLKEISYGPLESAFGPLPDACGEFLDVIEDLTPLGHLGQDLSLGVHDRGVVAAECLTDLGQ
jgi:hypothetical protein